MDFLDSEWVEEEDDNATNLEAEINQKLTDIDNLPNRLSRYGKAKGETIKIYSAVEQRINTLSPFSDYRKHLERIAPNLTHCADYLRFNHYFVVGTVRMVAANFCHKHLLCQFCAILRSAKLLKVYVARYYAIMAEPENQDLRLSLVTFTVKNGHGFEERYQHIKKSITKLLKNRRQTLLGTRGYSSEFSKAVAVVGSYETTNKGKGYHIHIHFIVLHRENFHYATLQAEWLKITGDSHVLNVRAAKYPENPAQDFIEVFKYFVKFGELSPDKIVDCYEVLRGKRLIVSAGLFRDVEIPEEDEDYGLDDQPYFELVYRYVMGSGYNLVSSEQKEPLPLEARPAPKPKAKKLPKQSKKEKLPVVALELPERIQREHNQYMQKIALRNERRAFQKSIDDVFSIDSS